MRQFKRMFRHLEDPRASHARHDLLEIIFIALAATLAGAKTCTDFEQFGLAREDMLRQLLELEHGIPSHDTFSNVFRALDPHALEAALRKFSKGFGIKGVVNLDGKALRGAFSRGRKAVPLHMVNVWAAGTRMALAQRKAPNRNEVAGALEVLSLLDLDGAIVTADALHCRPDIAHAIRGRRAHYVLAIKSNRGRLFTAAKALTDDARGASRATQRSRRAHGRVERRQALVVPAPHLAEQYGFPDIAAVGRLESWRSTNGRPAKPKVRLFLVSRGVLGQGASRRRARSLEHREQSPLGPRRPVRRGCLPQPQGSRAREPRRHPKARHQHPPNHPRPPPNATQNAPC